MNPAVLDHIVVSAEDLAAGTAHVEAALGVSLSPGGAHAVMGTHNNLLALGPRDYLEVISIDPLGSRPAVPRWYGLDAFRGAPRLTNWVLNVPDLDAALAKAPEGAGAPLEVTRGENRWRISVPKFGQTPFNGVFPAFIQWLTPPPPSVLVDQDLRLISLTLSHPEAGALGWALSPFLEDDRITVAKGPARIKARFHSPEGVKTLT